jgi:hypothetical protein
LQSQRNQVGVHAEAKETERGFGGPQARAVEVKAAKISCCEYAFFIVIYIVCNKSD